ncbi:MAG: bifunctional oligoribonuclease/PAP phosphatase NrnA [Actinobacteria bacterium]|nr:bifunctional oligoribonuclease/PAP phosphatase NrnA [Actinomycetota bacterium]
MSGAQEVAAALRRAGTVIATSHVNPDGDGVGSLLAVTIFLTGEGKRVYSCLPEPWKYPPQYAFLPGREDLVSPEQLPESCDLFLALDCSNLSRLEPLERAFRNASLTVNVDHHEDNSLFADVNYVDPAASSTAELVYRVAEAASWPLDASSATCLYAGLVTDTGRFQHRNTTPEAFRLAARMAEAGADIHKVAREIYESQSLQYARLLGIALHRARRLEDLALVFSYITQADLEETGATLAETEDLIDHLRRVRGAGVVALFKELADGSVRVSLRSGDGFEVGPIARDMGGGGHAMAAGYTFHGDLESSIDELVEALRSRHA